MATFRHRCGKWQAKICMRGVRKSKTFETKSDAKAWAATHGIDVLALARQLGHTDLKMTQRYYRPSAQELVEKINGLADY